MKKSTFYFICEHIHPHQVQSLFLSDDEHTPGQIKLFMSLLPLIKFNNLQYISINQVHDADLLFIMLSHLENHVQIQSLSINGYPIQVNKRKSRSITEILTTLPSLEHLTFIDSSQLITLQQPLSKLTHLTIHSCTFNDLRMIFHWVPNLFYLQISIPFGHHMVTFDYIPLHLSFLIIESKSWTLFNEFENLFSLTPSLKSLVLTITGEQDLLDGRRWKTLIKTKLPHLTKFALNITPEENNMTGDNVLIPFQDSFWTIEKRWHMACLISTTTSSCARLFSVPHFSSTDVWYPPGEGFFNYSLTPYSFNENCTELRLIDFPSENLIPTPFKHIRTLWLESSIDTIDQLQKFINLLSVNHLKIGGCVRRIPLNDLFQAAPNIYQLTMCGKTLVQIINSLPDSQNVFEQIKNLNMKQTVHSMDIDQICQSFPKLEHISLSVKNQDDIFRIFNELHYLNSIAAHWTCPFKTPLSVIDEYLQQNNICTDGTYSFHVSSLHVWMD
ncbi:unnamed protein product [Rotaria sp. Silwood1]|nr:unnamed protein product [Rotaria sp. Silwood1]